MNKAIHALLFWMLLFSLASAWGAEARPTAWFPLGAAFRICDPGTRFRDGAGKWDMDNTGPPYDDLVPDVYHEGHETEVQRHTLSLVAVPRWFEAAPVPRILEDVPLSEQGVSLAFVVKTTTNGLLRFVLKVPTSSRDLWREVEHRRTNVTPFLFSFWADGAPILPPPTNVWSGIGIGGVNGMTRLARKGSAYEADLIVDANTILALVPGKRASELTVVAAFGESQHHGAECVARHQALKLPWKPMYSEGYEGPPVSVRSSPVHLRYVHEQWEVIQVR